MVKLFCAVVGVAGSAVPITIDESETVDDLKKAIKEENKNEIRCDAKDLRLFLTKTDDGEWLKSKNLLRMRKGEIPSEVESYYKNEELEDPTDKIRSIFPSTIPDRTIHVLVYFFTVISTSPNITNNLLPTNQIRTKKSRVSVDDLMKNAKLFLDKDKGGDGSMVLIFRTKVEVKELPPFNLVLNYGTNYHTFDAESQEFIKLNDSDVSLLQGRNNVIRLIEGTSSELAGWHGISILFASPGYKGINDLSKVDTLRFVFIKSEELNTEDLDHAIASRNALKVISYAKSKSAVREDNYSHRVLQMVPSKTDFRTKFYFDFLSNHIAETIIDQLDQEILQKVSEFAVAHDGDDSGSTSVLRGKIYALLCHKWFSLPKQHNLVLCPLGDEHASVDVDVSMP
ncbi:hypothetical protein PPTG_22281 [Phytophthora nicotianae INRA-310]|uniref:Crinkler effector protein N-terminal domain-containing protein n=1 Tax=Phytophthora nicotianae (strain INRA-310) TaxID=761204 RepID=W2QLE1_PHYN3|nr:hypothetical protein PPTG_22281 [Phytophthora nicotianae INRA-310]ETN13963.1 hypothetical protein PPTG_22281 [Phytophthora nicotianae INRA-310]